MNYGLRPHSAILVLIVGTAATVLGCDRATRQLLVPPAHAPTATPQCLDRNAADYYYAPGQISETRDDSMFRRTWFREYLAAAGAGALSCGEPQETYRLLWLPAFRNAKIFTVRRSVSGWLLEIVDFGKELFPAVDSRKRHELVQRTMSLTEPEVGRIRQELALIGFWSTRQFLDHPEMMDGYALVIEGRSGDNYRAVTRINQWDGTEQVACPLFDIARIMLPDPIRCARPVTVE